MPTRCDLHLHSRFSDRPSEWYLDHLGAPESFTEPLEIYRACRQRGMDFVTITDHNEIRGALEIAHLPGTFLSSEVTATFPEDGCEVHCLVFGIRERDHHEIERLRGDIYALRDYLRAERIPCSVAHPLFRVNNRLGLAHVERLLVLFPCFEAINGTRDRRGTELLEAVCSGLTPGLMAELADRHGLEPWGPEPWVKRFTGGSDDHGGIYVGTTCTETPPAESAADYLAHLRAGRHRASGELGSTLKLARSFQALAHDYYRVKVLSGGRASRDPLAALLRRLADGEISSEGRLEASWSRGLRRALAFATGRDSGPAAGARSPRRSAVAAREAERRVFEGSARLAQRAVAHLVTALAARNPGVPLLTSLPDLSVLGPAALAASPYLAAFRFQHKDEELARQVARRFPGASHLARKGSRRLWAVDNLGEVNGVSRTVASLAGLACRRGLPLTVLTCGAEPLTADYECDRLPPIAEIPVPQYPGLRLSVPPFLELAEQCERQGFGEVIVSTPGPVGLAALAAARLLGLPATGIYHTDLPSYAALLGGGPRIGDLAGAYARWFYGQMDRILVPSRAYLEDLARRGLDPARIEILPRGVDVGLFTPARRDPSWFARYGRPPARRFLYAGRISREKNLGTLLAAYRQLRAEGLDWELVLVGDGPHLPELASRAEGSGALFTGFLHGEELASAYASCDLFVFPSLTDTFGNVVLEAMASGLPPIVAGHGPRELVEDGRSGLVLADASPESMAAAMRALAADDGLRLRLGRAARSVAEGRDWESVLDRLWHGSPTPERPAPDPELAALLARAVGEAGLAAFDRPVAAAVAAV